MERFLWMSAVMAWLLVGARPASADVVYSNGPIDGTYSGYYFYSGSKANSISDSFTVSSPTSITSATELGIWTDPGAHPTGWQWSIGTSPFASDIASGSATPSYTLHDTAYGGSYDVWDTSFGMSVPTLATGTYWITLTNGTASDGGFVGWDTIRNSGPSQAFQANSSPNPSSIPSGSFTLNNNSSTAVPEPASLRLFGVGACALMGYGWKRRKAKS